MHFTTRKKTIIRSSLPAILLLVMSSPAWAAGPAEPALFSNPLTVSLVSLMIVLLIIIAILANILLGVAGVRVKKDKLKNEAIKTIASLVVAILITASPLTAQTVPMQASPTAATIGGISSLAFYIMASVIFLELLIILVLLMNVRILLKVEKEKLVPAARLQKPKRPFAGWWNRINSFKPLEQETDIDLGHDYDGIRELDNRLPPWWLYGFYFTIIVAGVYLWRFHVSHTGPSSREEYEMSLAVADHEIKEYLAKKGESVDENSVIFLSSADDITAGRKIFTSSCAACHKENGGGDVGPNLTDEYWLHGSDIKSIFKTIRYGINAMPQWQNSYSNKQIAQVASYVKSLKGTNPPNPKSPQGELSKEDISSVKVAADSTAVK